MISVQIYAGWRRLASRFCRFFWDNAESVKKAPPSAGTFCTRSCARHPYLATTWVTIQRRRATTTPSRNATNRLCSGACRVTARSLAIGCPGRSAFAITTRKRSTATLSAAVTSSIPRDTSVAASIARSAMLGDGICGVSSLTLGAFRVGYEATTFGYPRERLFFEQRVASDLWLSATGAVMNGGWRPPRKNAEWRDLFRQMQDRESLLRCSTALTSKVRHV